MLLPEVRIGRSVRIRSAIIDKHCRIPDGFAVGFDPLEDQRRFHVSAGGIALITAEMRQSVHECS